MRSSRGTSMKRMRKAEQLGEVLAKVVGMDARGELREFWHVHGDNGEDDDNNSEAKDGRDTSRKTDDHGQDAQPAQFKLVCIFSGGRAFLPRR